MHETAGDYILDNTHMWILPQYISARWWEVDKEILDSLPVSYKCNNSDILKVLNRVNLLVVDSMKYNILEAKSEDYHGEYKLVRSTKVYILV